MSARYPFCCSGLLGFCADRSPGARAKQTKGTVQFPLDRPIPFDLVKKIKFRVKENESKRK